MKYLEGDGVPQDMTKAAALLDQAAEPEKYQKQGLLADLFGGQSSSVAPNPGAQMELGLLYQEGQGVDRDPTKAVALYTRAAFSDDPAAQAELGILYEKGIGVTKDPVTAYAWFSLAADQHDDDGIRGMQRVSQVLSADQIDAAKKLHDQFAASIH